MPERSAQFRPFHETIVEQIDQCLPSEFNKFIGYLELVEKTAIPKGHDDIMASIDRFFAVSGAITWFETIDRVKESVLEQKRLFAEKVDAHAAENG